MAWKNGRRIRSLMYNSIHLINEIVKPIRKLLFIIFLFIFHATTPQPPSSSSVAAAAVALVFHFRLSKWFPLL